MAYGPEHCPVDPPRTVFGAAMSSGAGEFPTQVNAPVTAMPATTG
jgi:hypothetical protein